jgi:hypothetical protein
MDELEQDLAIGKGEQKSAQKKAPTRYKNNGLALDPVEYEQEEMDCDEELRIMEASVPDFLHWSQRAYWTLDQGIALLLAKNPHEVYWERVQNYVSCYYSIPLSQDYSIPLCQDYAKLRMIAVQASVMNEIKNQMTPAAFLEWADKKCLKIPKRLKQQVEKIKAKANIKNPAAEADKARFELMKKKLEASVDALKAKDLKICELQKEQYALQKRIAELENLQWKGFNKEDPTYSRELDIAVAAYLYVSRNWQEGKSIKKQILDLLKAKYPKNAKGESELSKLEMERIARICNWQKSGGAPRTPEKTQVKMDNSDA